MSRVSKVIIVGAGFGGLKAAQHLKGAPVDITLIDRRNHHLFQPLLYQVATAGLSPADIAVPVRSIFSRQKNVEVLMSEVRGVDVVQRQVITDPWRLPYDYLVIATGSTHSYFGHPEWSEAAPGLKTIQDATTIRQRILLAFEKAETESDPVKREALLTFILVGGGPTGVEMAGSIAELGHTALARDFRHVNPKLARIILIEAGPRILAAFPEELSRKAHRELEDLGVEVRLNARVQNVSREGVELNGGWLAARTVIWCAGVVASPAAKWLGLEGDRAGRVKVGPDLTIPGHPEIFVIGDTAAAVDESGHPLPGVAPVAMQQGRYVARVIRDRLAGREPAPRFHYVNKGNLATVGRSAAVADLGWLRLSGFPAWVTWLVVHIFYLIGFRNRILVMINWAWLYVTFKRGARLITTEEA